MNTEHEQSEADRTTLRLTDRVERAAEHTDKAKITRQFVTFTFYKTRPEWRILDAQAKLEAKREFVEVFDSYRRSLLLHTYSIVGLRSNVDFMIWRIGYSLDPFQEMSARLSATRLGRYLDVTQSFLSMTKRSMYIDKDNPEHVEDRLHIVPGQSKYLFVYPFVKTREWYGLPVEQRQEMMDEHIRVGSKYRSVKLHTTYSFGLDDQEFVVAFETDYPSDFLDLVQELRESKASRYTLRDTPMYTCRQLQLAECLEALDMAESVKAGQQLGDMSNIGAPVEAVMYPAATSLEDVSEDEQELLRRVRAQFEEIDESVRRMQHDQEDIDRLKDATRAALARLEAA